MRKPLVICVRVEDFKHSGDAIPGNKVVPCSVCHAPCLQASSTQKLPYDVICTRCLPAHMASFPAHVVVRAELLPETLREIADWERRN